MSRTLLVTLLGLTVLVGPASAQTGGWVEPNPNKPPDVFRAEQEQCRTYAEHALRYAEPEPPTGSTVGGAVAGMVIGATVGGAVGHRSGAVIGAGTGAVAGAIIASSADERASQGSEARYQAAYRACLRSYGNLGPGDPIPPPPPPPPGWSPR